MHLRTGLCSLFSEIVSPSRLSSSSSSAHLQETAAAGNQASSRPALLDVFQSIGETAIRICWGAANRNCSHDDLFIFSGSAVVRLGGLYAPSSGYRKSMTASQRLHDKVFIERLVECFL